MSEHQPGVSTIAVESIVECTHHGERLRFCIASRADHIQAFHAAGRFYEEAQLEAFAALCPGDRVFLDIGANIGNHTLYMARVRKVRQVVPFEVNPDAISILRINLALNGCRNVDDSYLGIGLSAREQRMTRVESYADNLGGTRFTASDTGEFLSIPADPLVAHLAVGAIKIDVAGMETGVLQGLALTIARWRPALFIELEDRYFDTFQKWLQDFRYTVAASFAPYVGKTEYTLVPM